MKADTSPFQQTLALANDATRLVCVASYPLVGRLLLGAERDEAIKTIKANHYTHSIPSGKSHYISFESALVVWAIPANKNIARFVLGQNGNVWELSRLWAPDGHEKNLLTRAICVAVKWIERLERPDALVSYADPNAGHSGGVYRAASWVYHGSSDESRTYRAPDGRTIARRAFHSGGKGMKKAEIEALGYAELKLPGKERFVRPLTKLAKRAICMCNSKNNANATGGRNPLFSLGDGLFVCQHELDKIRKKVDMGRIGYFTARDRRVLLLCMDVATTHAVAKEV